VEERNELFIGGKWVGSSGSGTIEVVDPATEETVGRVPEGVPDDVDRAVRHAAGAFPGWSARSVAERVALVDELATAIGTHAEPLATTITHEVGSPLAFSRSVQVGLPMAVSAGLADAVAAVAWEEPVGPSLVVREPVGVVGAITPWNYPLHQVVAKVLPAIAAGCTVVLKPSEVAPLTAFALAEMADDVGLPPGVLNLVTGLGPVVGEAIAGHGVVDMVSLTGSTGAGQRVMELAAPTAKRVTLELGGKSAAVYLDDVDPDALIPGGVVQGIRNSGQNCSALSRLVVPRRWLDRVEQLAATAAESVVVGDPFDPRTEMGPVVSHPQRERVCSFIRAGVEEGAALLAGGTDPPAGLGRGYFVRPTVFSRVTPDMSIAQEEIFGPVMCILAYDDEDEAIELANDSRYGLSGAVWSADPDRAERVARRLRTGRVVINGAPLNPAAPFGGYKQSGIGRELGRYGVEEFLETKTLQR
jgi:aldehyde dehydrogenase (NAD+)